MGSNQVRGGASEPPQFEGEGLVFAYSPSASPAGGPMWTVRCVIDGQHIRADAPTVNEAWGRVQSRVMGRPDARG